MERLCSSDRRADREALFQQTASELGLSATAVEKDFWVCLVLGRLFGPLSETIPSLCFKGGTSLSKVYRLIQRFSEDIDLSLDRSALLEASETDPLEFPGSKSKRKELIQTLRERAAQRLHTRLVPALRGDLGLLVSGAAYSIEVDKGDPLTLLFEYPASFPPAVGSQVKPLVRLEFGIADQLPAQWHEVSPYAAENFPDFFEGRPSCKVRVLDVGRTFWEKALILHELHHRSEAGSLRAASLSRHYYDVYMLAQSGDVDSWIANQHLRQDVISFKEIFFQRAAARYELARPGRELTLAPRGEWRKDIKLDYHQLSGEMLFGDPPEFAELCEKLEDLERSILGSEMA